MNSHTTPRTAFQGRSLGGSGIPPQSRQPVAPQVSANEDYSTIPEEDREHIDEVGWLNSYEFRHSLAALGFDMSKPDYFRELQSYGSVPPEWQDPHTCPVNRLYVYLDQFRLCAAKLLASRDPRQEATKVFNMFDYDGDGVISFEDMRRLASDIKEERTMTDEEIQSMIEHLDHEGKGGVNLEEFIQMMEEAG
ncbi:unnamed protein product [Fusarium graminearum]|uniref:EF-hand domain-containing protein n=1 Tax=Gibberella zeae (strain ATCC MYA-4620 / CBS 123657 / FGSC 9075 / NRRL 31084 / PH-1) TaxID=229533 RepID=I1RW33_GIBZE|nr:hypothetical protein FGSG_08486 [Fusarium graminearum PH-1]ESU14852.1 hypothetical protein FGSG_08486 [Fusarium graminearum PH-1]CZS80135.1 unnamed protein product [Fusarium graminearum]|eukprot:XP_011320277.1 hypothetical protein FGSG_08486 [Fusarium graminearum PH-1]